MSLGPGRSGRRNGPQVEQRNWTKGSKNTWATHNVLDKMPHTRVGKGGRGVAVSARFCVPPFPTLAAGADSRGENRQRGPKRAKSLHPPSSVRRPFAHPTIDLAPSKSSLGRLYKP